MLWHRYMATCLGRTNSEFLFLEVTSSDFTLKYSETVFMISVGVISLVLLG